MTSTVKLALALSAAGLLYVPVAQANPWNEKTILTFSSPVMVPGATLPPGTYVFQIGDFTASRHIVRIYMDDEAEHERRLITTTQAVPMRRLEANDEIVVLVSPTATGVPAAVKGWFYPGTQYGHEFIYPEDQARLIAERTKTLVLSDDVTGSDVQKGTIQTLDASGQRTPWKPDDVTQREWDNWRKNQTSASPSGAKASKAGQSPQRAADRTDAAAGATAATRSAPGASSVPLAHAGFVGKRVDLDAVEDDASKFIGQRISVDAEVEEVYGPRLFTIDERNWADLDGEILVFMPTSLAAMVREGDQVTVTGTVRPFMRAEIEREWGWFDLEPETELDIARKPILVADRIVGGDDQRAMVIQFDEPGTRARGTSGAPETSGTSAASRDPVKDVRLITEGETDLVGRHVALDDLRVVGPAKDGRGFVGQGPSDQIFVLPSMASDQAAITAGAMVDVRGVVMQMPERMRDRLSPSGPLNGDIYILANSVEQE